MDYKIDEDVPFTDKRKPRVRFCDEYPVDALRIGQSFLIEIDSLSPDSKTTSPLYYSVAQGLNRYNRDHKDADFVLKFRMRRMKRHGENGIRIWKIAKEKTV